MPDLKIKIETIGELAGAKSVEAGLERDIGKAKVLGQEFGELQARLNQVSEAVKEAETRFAEEAAARAKADEAKKKSEADAIAAAEATAAARARLDEERKKEEAKKAADAQAMAKVVAKTEAEAQAKREEAFQQELKRLEAFEAAQKKQLEEYVSAKKKQVLADIDYSKSSAGVSSATLLESVAVGKSTATSREAAQAKKQLKDSLKGLALEFPLVSKVADLAMNPISALVGGIAVGVKLWHSRMQDIIAVLNPSDWKNREAIFERQAAAVHNVQSALSYYRRSLLETGKAQDALVGSSERWIALMKEQSDWIKQNAEAEKEVALAKIEQDEKSGKISPEQAVRARAKVNKDFNRTTLEAELSDQAGVIDHKKKERDAIEGALPTLAEERERAGRELVEAVRAEEGFLGEKTRAQENLAIQEKKLEELKKHNRESMFPSADSTKAEFDTDAVAQRLREQLGSMDAQESGISERRREAEERLKAIQEQERAAVSRRNTLNEELPGLESSFGIKEGTGRDILKKKEQAEDIRTQTQIEEIRRQKEEQEEKEAERRRKGGNGSPGGLDLSGVSDASDKTVAASQAATKEITGAFLTVAEGNQQLAREMATLKAQYLKNRRHG